MQWMNRNVMDALNMGPWAWMDSVLPRTYYASAGNYWDQILVDKQQKWCYNTTYKQ